MTDPDPTTEAAAEPAVDAPAEAVEPEWKRKRRLAEVFGDVLPETTTDERTPGAEEAPSSDAWFKAQVPPHHG